MDVEDIQTKKSRRQSGEQIINHKRFQPDNSNNNNPMTSLTKLPDELWIIILSYLNIVDIFRAFDGLNQRFNNLIYDSARNITLPSDTSSLWFEQHMSQLEYKIKTICLNDESLEYVFDNKRSFPNLQLINLQGDEWNISLRIRKESLLISLLSSLYFLKNVGHSINTSFIDTLNGIINDEDNYRKTLSCPFIERLSTDECSKENLIRIVTGAPNLIYLEINDLTSGWYDDDLVDRFDPIKRTTHLVELNITIYEEINFILLEQVINSCKTSLKKLILGVHCHQPIDGYHLEEIFKSCEKLEKLVFLFEYNNEKVDIDDCQRSFQSQWWLDARRRPVYIQHNEIGGTLIVSMPSHYSFIFKNDLNNWYVNKGDQNSSFVHFTNIKRIHFTNNVHQPISLEYLYSIDRVFTSPNQSLCFDFCDLKSVNILFELLMDDTSIAPVLPNVYYFSVGSSNKLDSLMLSVWILLMPNLQKLDISKLTTFNKIELAKELRDMIDDNERLKPTFNHIYKLIIFSQCDEVDGQTMNELIVAFKKVFIKADIS